MSEKLCEKHFHYKSVPNQRKIDLFLEKIIDENVFSIKVVLDSNQFSLSRSLADLEFLDRTLHKCIFLRKFSNLENIFGEKSFGKISEYLRRFSELTQFLELNCNLVLNWFELNSSFGHFLTFESEINKRGICAAFVVKEFEKNSTGKETYLSLELGEIVSIIELNDSLLRGKKGFEVGLIPFECVQIITKDSNARHVSDDTTQTNVQSVVRSAERVGRQMSAHKKESVGKRHRTFSTFLQKFSQKKETNVERKRVFGKDLSELLFEREDECAIPLVLRVCTQFVESFGVLDGIYRLSGITSNIQRLRQLFDNCDHDSDVIAQMVRSVETDVHCVSSLLKQFFRELPNPLLTYNLYNAFIVCVQNFLRDKSNHDNSDSDDGRHGNAIVRDLCELCSKLPPKHFFCLKHLLRHLSKMSKLSSTTGMTTKNLAIVWAPNLLRSREQNCIKDKTTDRREFTTTDFHCLHLIGIQAVLTEFLINNYDNIFEHNLRQNAKVVTHHKSHSFDSFFSKNKQTIDKTVFALNFAKTETMFDSFQVLTHFENEQKSRRPQTTVNECMKCEAIQTTHCDDVIDNCRSLSVKTINTRNDSIVLRQKNETSRERIEKIKAERRQQLRQQFCQTIPTPTPRKTITGVNKWHKIGPKVDSRRVTSAPVPTPRRRNSCETTTALTSTTVSSMTSAIRITALKTVSKSKRNNWNTSAVQVFEPKDKRF